MKNIIINTYLYKTIKQDLIKVQKQAVAKIVYKNLNKKVFQKEKVIIVS